MVIAVLGVGEVQTPAGAKQGGHLPGDYPDLIRVCGHFGEIGLGDPREISGVIKLAVQEAAFLTVEALHRIGLEPPTLVGWQLFRTPLDRFQFSAAPSFRR